MNNLYNILILISITIIISACLDNGRNHSYAPEKPEKSAHSSVENTMPEPMNEVVKDTINIATTNPFDKADSTNRMLNLLNRAEEDKKKSATMRQEHTQSLRRAIDLYKKNQQPNAYLDNLAIDISKDNTLNDPVKKDVYSMKRMMNEGYLEGKFVLFRIDNKPMGSVTLDIMFRHKQDKLFRVLMIYDSLNDSFIVRSIYVPTEYDENDLRLYRKLYSIYLNDDSFGV